MVEFMIVTGIAFVIFVLFLVIVLRSKKDKKKSPMYSCGACSGNSCDCSIEDAES